MPTITVNRKVVEKVMGKKLPDNELKDRISMLGTDLEHVDEDEIVVEIFPNRPDMLSEQGFGRALSSFIGVKTGLRKYNVKKSGFKVIVDKSVEMRPFTACAIVRNIKFTNERIIEVMQMQEKLATTHGRRRVKSAYGVYPIDNVTFPIKYTTKDPNKLMFQPLGFEEKMPAIKTEKVHPTAPKYKHIADKWREAGYTKYPFFIDAKDNVMCMLPYTNSHDTGKIDEKTTQVFIECTGTDLNNVHYALNIFVTMFADMGADIFSLDIKYPDKTITTPNLKPTKMKIDLKYVNDWLGLNLKENELKKYLERMGFGYENKIALIPSYRPDVIHQVDLAEDVAIAYGYENFKEEIPTKGTTAKEDVFEKFRKKVVNVLIGLNLLETSSYHLSNNKVQFKMMKQKTEDCVQLANSLSEEYNILRYNMLANLMQILKENTHNEYPQNIFESGKVFKLGETETGVHEQNNLSVVLCNKDVDYTKIRQVLDCLFRAVGLEYNIKETEHPSFIPGRAGKVVVNKKELGVIGEVHPQVITNFEVEMPIAAFEINLSELFELYNEEKPEYVKQDLISVSKDLMELAPELVVKTSVIENVFVKEKSDYVEKHKQALFKEWKKKELSKEYINFHKKIGADKPAVESLVTRYIKKNIFPSVNSTVDLANYVSLKNMASVGLFDYDKIKGEIILRHSKKGDKYIPYGKTTSQKINEGKPILQDSEKIFAMVGVKDSIETKVDKDTNNLLIISWGFDKDKVSKTLNEFEKLVNQYN